MTWVASAVVSAGLTYQVAQSVDKKHKAKKGLAELNKTPIQEVGVSPELQSAYTGAQDRSKYGFSPTETAAFNQNLSRAQNTQFQQAKDVGGGQMAGTLNRMGNVETFGALNQFASKGAGLQLQKIEYADQLGSQIQAIKDKKVEDARAYRIMLEQQYGGAKRQQQENMNNAVGSATAIGAQVAQSYQTQKNYDAQTAGNKTVDGYATPAIQSGGLNFPNTMGANKESNYSTTANPYTATGTGTPMSTDEYNQWMIQNNISR